MGRHSGGGGDGGIQASNVVHSQLFIYIVLLSYELIRELIRELKQDFCKIEKKIQMV